MTDIIIKTKEKSEKFKQQMATPTPIGKEDAKTKTQEEQTPIVDEVNNISNNF